MRVYLEGKEIEVNDGINLLQFIIDNSPYGEESVVCDVNGNTYRSIDDNITSVVLKDGDKISIFPLVIGG